MSDHSDWHILVIDDEKDILDVMYLILSDNGYQVTTAPDGTTALELCRKTPPRIVITDIRMPGMNGLEVLEKVKKIDPDIEVIVCTAFAEMDFAIQALQLDATDFITKPINVDALEIAFKRVEEKIITRKQLQQYTENLERLIREKTELQDNLTNLVS